MWFNILYYSSLLQNFYLVKSYCVLVNDWWTHTCQYQMSQLESEKWNIIGSYLHPAVQINNFSKSTSKIKVATTKKWIISKGELWCAIAKFDTFHYQQIGMGCKGGHWKMCFTYSSMPRGTSQAEAMSGSEKINPVPLELCLSESISSYSSYFIKHFYSFVVPTIRSLWELTLPGTITIQIVCQLVSL